MPRRVNHYGVMEITVATPDGERALTDALHLLLPIRRQRLLRGENRLRDVQQRLRQVGEQIGNEAQCLAEQRQRYSARQTAFARQHVGRRQPLGRLNQTLSQERALFGNIALHSNNLQLWVEERSALRSEQELIRQDIRRRQREVEKLELWLTQFREEK